MSSQSIAQAARTMFTGTTVGQYREGDRLIDIVLRQTQDERDTLPASPTPICPRPRALHSRSRRSRSRCSAGEPGVMWRSGRDYAITVQGDLVEGMQGATVTEQLPAQSCHARGRWQATGGSGVRIEVAGAVESSQGLVLHRGWRTHHAVLDLHAADAAAAQLQPLHAGVFDRAAGHCRCGGALLLLGRRSASWRCWA